jgi:hypothetical protein
VPRCRRPAVPRYHRSPEFDRARRRAGQGGETCRRSGRRGPVVWLVRVADPAHGPASPVLLLRRVPGQLRLHPGVGAADPGPGLMVAGKRLARRHARPSRGLRRGLHGRRRSGRVRGPGALAGLAGRGCGAVRGGDRAGPGRVRADPAPAGRLLEQRRPGIDRRRVHRGRGHRAAAGRRYPGRRPGCGELPAIARQRVGAGQPAGGAGAAVRLGRGHPAQGQDLDRPVRAVRAPAVPGRRAAAGAAALAVGPLAVPAKAGQAGQGAAPGAAVP